VNLSCDRQLSSGGLSLKLVLEPIFEADFKPSSYGFRPNRRAQDAISEIHIFSTNRYEWVLECDIKACFDEISHTALMDRQGEAQSRFCWSWAGFGPLPQAEDGE
jgi:Reverse transcriptase (RNA-dependent DNA polymerase)